MLVADAPPNTAPKKIPTPEPKFAVVAISHVKGEFKYGSGMIELCLYDFNGPSFAFFGVPHFSVIPPTCEPKIDQGATTHSLREAALGAHV